MSNDNNEERCEYFQQCSLPSLTAISVAMKHPGVKCAQWVAYGGMITSPDEFQLSTRYPWCPIPLRNLRLYRHLLQLRVCRTSRQFGLLGRGPHILAYHDQGVSYLSQGRTHY